MLNIDVTTPKFTLGEARAFEFTVKAASLDLGDMTDKLVSDIKVSGEIVYTGTAYRLTTIIKATKEFVCDICLSTARSDLVLAVEEIFSSDKDNSSLTLFDGREIPLGDVLRDILLASEPPAEVCKADCKGLCPKCGKNLNEGTCSCDTFTVDPRLEILKDFKLASDE